MATYFAMTDGLLLVRAAPSARQTAKVTSSSGWTDLSKYCQGITIAETVAIREATHQGSDRPTVEAGLRTATLTLNFTGDDTGAADTPNGFLLDLSQSNYRFNICIQAYRTPLESAGVVTPAPSRGNPQYAGSAVVENPGDLIWGDGSAPTPIAVTARVDSDWQVYDA